MTSRSDIIDGDVAHSRNYGLVYTKKCGWVDLGHANPAGAANLWNKIKRERATTEDSVGYYRISYAQMMGNKLIKVGVHKRYEIKKGISLAQKKSVALSIFLDVSKEFESMQGNWLFNKLTNSSFSAEDLVSNLIGFYRAVEPGKPFIEMCEPVKKEIALKIWDKFGAVGSNKNHTTVPYVYPLPGNSGGPMSVALPPGLNTIRPSQQGELFRELP